MSFSSSAFRVPLPPGEPAGYPNGPVVNDSIKLAFGAMLVCIGVAVLKYRLYEIDRIISRVISYASSPPCSPGCSPGWCCWPPSALPVKSPVAVAASTLVAAALFNPLRRRVQRVVDRRFNRARYNAEAVVAAFTARLRQTVDFDAVRADLTGVVHEAFQPAQVSMWLVEQDRVMTRVPYTGDDRAPAGRRERGRRGGPRRRTPS